MRSAVAFAITQDEVYAADAAELSRREAEADAARARALDALAANLSAAVSAAANTGFPTLLRSAQRLLHLNDLEMSRMLKVSRPTIGRWIRGTSAPHPLARNAIVGVLAKKARSEAKSLKK